MTKPARRAADGFSLAFLDVMACGLGAVILIFILIDFDAFQTSPSSERQQLEQELQNIQLQKNSLTESIEALNQAIASAQSAQNEKVQTQQDTQQQQNQLLQSIEDELAVIAELENQLAAMSKEVEKSANVTLRGTGEQNYITGMKVEGKRIGILIDKSASMMGTNLVDVLGKLALTDNKKCSTAKWLRTQRVAQWLLARLPQNAQVTTVAFSDKAQVLAGPALSVSDGLNPVVDALQQVVPDGGTNLQLGVKTLFDADSNISHVYLVTDGLPTLGDGLPLSCRRKAKNKNTISSDCRLKLFGETVKRAPGRARYNVILLPIEGDPYASSMYWDWSRSSGGTFLAPTQRWP